MTIDLRTELQGRYVQYVEPDHHSLGTQFAHGVTLVLSDGPQWGADLLTAGDGNYWFRYKDRLTPPDPYIVRVEGGLVYEFGYDKGDPVKDYVAVGEFAGPLVAPTDRLSRVVVEPDAIVEHSPNSRSTAQGILTFSVEQLSEQQQEAAHGD